MFKRMLGSSAQGPVRASVEETPASHAGQLTPTISELTRTDASPKTTASKLPPFEEIYRRSTFKTNTATAEWHILKVAEMLNSEHLRGLSATAKHSALMMALEAAGVAVEDILQDAVQRQRVLNDYEAMQLRRLHEIEGIKLRDNERLTNEMESICTQYRTRIAAGVAEIERERGTVREWQECKEQEQRRLAEAASACVASDSSSAATSSDASVTRLLEKNANTTRYRESA
jgi:hypothetical protein